MSLLDFRCTPRTSQRVSVTFDNFISPRSCNFVCKEGSVHCYNFIIVKGLGVLILLYFFKARNLVMMCPARLGVRMMSRSNAGEHEDHKRIAERPERNVRRKESR